MYVTLRNPEKFNIIDANNELYYGGSQEWFKERWRRQSGCGAVAATNLIWYMCGEHSEIEHNSIEHSGIEHNRIEHNGIEHNRIEQYIELMSEMFNYVAPGILGVNSSAIFTNGIKRFGERHKLSLTARILEIPIWRQKRPSIEAANEFIATALHNDAPVAFLNLSKGMLKNLGSWHWVTITAFDKETMQAKIGDYGKIANIDINLWLKSSVLGGAFVYL